MRRSIGDGYANRPLGVDASDLYLAVRTRSSVSLFATPLIFFLKHEHTQEKTEKLERKPQHPSLTTNHRLNTSAKMQFFTALFLAALTSAAIAQPGTQVKRADADNGPIFVEPLDVFPSDPTITEAPVVDANAVRVNDVDYESTSSCTPASICFDGITCGMRYGG